MSSLLPKLTAFTSLNYLTISRGRFTKGFVTGHSNAKPNRVTNSPKLLILEGCVLSMIPMSRMAVLSTLLIVVVVTLTVTSAKATDSPAIYSVTFTYSPSAPPWLTMTINGVGFGNGVGFVAANGGYGGIDTVKSGTTASLGICDIRGGVQQWNAGGKYTSSINVGHGCTVGGYNAIGVYLDAWTSTKVVLGGFGGAIPKDGYHIHTGDTLVFVVFGPSNSGYSTYVTNYLGPTV